ncbi:hypothetical protein [Mobilicoccus caccae]|uniref:Uncharacterized protein n=1 Tax=Mobilicoccus caccae TaxID=1859295 RepID=A0ABQ6IKL6_9MICO|nr:hypothetical protein [Mobilicoccus caccae]GMA38483.1 hypothetical protein GCM10025883_05280 [Mobilicoccus caccae]
MAELTAGSIAADGTLADVVALGAAAFFVTLVVFVVFFVEDFDFFVDSADFGAVDPWAVFGAFVALSLGALGLTEPRGASVPPLVGVVSVPFDGEAVPGFCSPPAVPSVVVGAVVAGVSAGAVEVGAPVLVGSPGVVEVGFSSAGVDVVAGGEDVAGAEDVAVGEVTGAPVAVVDRRVVVGCVRVSGAFCGGRRGSPVRR